MPVKQPKKLLILNILDILRKYSDEEHRLSQKDITEILKTEYDMTADRKAIRRNILNLMDCGCSLTACFFPSTSLTASARSWWTSWRVCPTCISAAG